ncbi:hypothetical protein ACFV9C_40965 [Kribbella sp. NPDC059898]|uniref:hypothetical protein n=1 Tax=Kribbella sp. NPDC059898 TaxID=3346995 RepID=UPI00364BFD24
MTPLGSLTREPITIEGVEWTSKVVRTGGPSGLLHDEWSLSIRFACDLPFRAAAFLDSDGVRQYARDWARHAEQIATLNVTFNPYDWLRSDEVQLTAGGIRATFESAALKTNPISATTVHIATGASSHTGVPLTVLTIPEAGASLAVLPVRSTDTKGNRTRWRLRDKHTQALGNFAFLTTGHRSGQLHLSG